jgi:hypothetical protein
MQLSINKEGNIELDLFDIVSEVIGRATEEERQTMVEYFGLQEPIRKWMVERWADDYSRPSYNNTIHKDRLDFLTKIKQEEMAYYADKIVDKINDEYRHNKAFWELYHWCQTNEVTRQKGFPSTFQLLKESDWDWRRGLDAMVKDIIKNDRPDLIETKTESTK